MDDLFLPKLLEHISSGGDCHTPEVEVWLSESEENYAHYQELLIIWNLTGSFPERLKTDKATAWNKIQNHIHIQPQKNLKLHSHFLRLTQYAAAVFFVLFTGITALFLYNSNQSKQLVYTTVYAEAGQISNVLLPDQSNVWLNAGSSLKYSNQFGTNNRQVELSGEAYFQVTKNKSLPFRVTGSNVHVEVLGTKFNVSAYPDESLFKVALEEGSVNLVDAKTRKLLRQLKPDELAILNKKGNHLSVEKTNIAQQVSWKQGIVNIYNLSLEDVVTKLSRRYNQQFEIEPRIRDIPYTYVIKHENLPQILKIMETVSPIEAVQEGQIIKLKYKPSN